MQAELLWVGSERLVERWGRKEPSASGVRGLTPPPLTSMRRSCYAALAALIFTLSINGCHWEATTCTSVNPAALSFPR
jgi:hypothetical protein